MQWKPFVEKWDSVVRYIERINQGNQRNQIKSRGRGNTRVGTNSVDGTIGTKKKRKKTHTHTQKKRKKERKKKKQKKKNRKEGGGSAIKPVIENGYRSSSSAACDEYEMKKKIKQKRNKNTTRTATNRNRPLCKKKTKQNNNTPVKTLPPVLRLQKNPKKNKTEGDLQQETHPIQKKTKLGKNPET